MELKVCPFCGADRAHTYMIRNGRRAGCQSCGASAGSHHHGPTGMPTADERAIAAWNQRAPDPRVEVLREALRLFTEAAYPPELNSRGWDWSEVRLDVALSNASKALADTAEEGEG